MHTTNGAPMKISKLFVLAITMISAGISFAQRTEVDLDVGTAMQISLQKEIYGILISDTDEVQTEYKEQGVMYKNDKLDKYKAILGAICERDRANVCPEVYFTKRVQQGIAAMYPNGVLVINEAIAARINDNEATFLVAHEYAHYKFNHSKQRMTVIAKSVADHGYMIREPEQALQYGSMFNGVKEAHYDYENQADAYGFAYVVEKGLKLECEKMFLKIADGAVISNDKHDSVAKRCTSY